MILGHWYLVLPSMDVSLLQRIVKFHIASTIVRIAVVGAVAAVALATWQAPSGAGFDSYVLSIEGSSSGSGCCSDCSGPRSSRT